VSDGDGVWVLGVGFVVDEGCRTNTQGGGGGGGWEEERLFVEEITKTMPFQNFFNFLIKQGHFRNFTYQNDVVLSIPSILTVKTNGGGHFIRG
jgi:hypothetical protein